MILLLVFIIFMWVVLNIFVTNENYNYYKDWFGSLKECTIAELILIFILFLPTTIVMALIYILSIKPFK